MTEDAGGYFQDAIWLLEGKTISPFWPPGLPYFLAAIMSLTGPNISVAMAGMLLWFLGFCGGMILLAARWFSPKTISILLSIFCIYPAYIHHSVAPLSHLPVAVCLLFSLLLILRIYHVESERSSQVKTYLYAFLLGSTMACMGFFRPAALILIPVLLLGLYFLEKSNRRPSWRPLLFALLIALSFIATWELHLYRMHDRWVGINDASSMNIFIGNHPQTPLYRTWWLGSHDERVNPKFGDFYEDRRTIRELAIADQGQAYLQAAKAHIIDQPHLFLLRSLNRIRCFFAFDTYVGARAFPYSFFLSSLFLLLDALIFIGVGIGAILAWQHGIIPRWIQTWFILIILAYAAPYWISFSHPTYHFSIFPLIAILSAQIIERPSFHNKGKMFRKVGIAIFALIQLEWVVMMLS